MVRKSAVALALCLSGIGGCAAQQPASDTTSARYAWTNCVVYAANACVQKYNDAEMCANLAVSDCRPQKVAFANAMAAHMANPWIAVKTANDIDAQMRVDLTYRLKKAILDKNMNNSTAQNIQ